MNIEIQEGEEKRRVQLTPVDPPFVPLCRLYAYPCPTEPDCSHAHKTQEVKPCITHCPTPITPSLARRAGGPGFTISSRRISLYAARSSCWTSPAPPSAFAPTLPCRPSD